MGVLVTLFALFAWDFTQAFLPKQADFPIATLIFVIFALFLVEIAVTSFAKNNYSNSLYFWCVQKLMRKNLALPCS